LWGHLKDAMCRTVQSQNYSREEAEGSCTAIPVHTLVDVCHSVQLRSAWMLTTNLSNSYSGVFAEKVKRCLLLKPHNEAWFTQRSLAPSRI
jgi:hypothetical protein